MILRAEEFSRRQDFGIKLLSEDSLKRLRLCENNQSGINSADYAACSYHVINNPKYQSQFGYAPAGLREGNERVNYQVNLGLYGHYLTFPATNLSHQII
jgi:hypothetical protein